MSQIILGLVGPIASGKGVLANHLRDHNFKVFSLSDKVREEADARGLPHLRENLQDLGDELRKIFGNQILAERVAFDLIGEEGNIVIDSIRNPGEVTYLKNLFNTNIKIIGVDASPETRFERYLQRAAERGEDIPDAEHFFKSSLRDQGIGQGEHGQQVHRCLELSDIIFENNGTKNEVLKELEIYLQKEFDLFIEGGLTVKEKR